MFKKYIFCMLLLCMSSLSYAERPQTIGESKYYGGHLCSYEDFTCVKVKHGDTWEKLFPNEREREMVKRLNRTNLGIWSRPWIVVPKALKELDYVDLSPFPQQIDAIGEELVVVNLSAHAFAAYDAEGFLVHWGPVSGGKGWCSDVDQQCTTAVGSFRISHKKGQNCISNTFPVETAGGAPMPYCMFYYRGFALHGSTLPGYHASHGCVRLFNEDAEWLNKSFLKAGSKVIVTQ